MRIQSVLAVLLFAAAAPAPTHAQRTDPVYHGDGFEIELPAKVTPIPTKSTQAVLAEQDIDAQLVAVGENALVMVMRYSFDEIPDTTLATRRALLQLARVGMMTPSSDVKVSGEPREVELGDRLGLRVSISMPPDEERDATLYGTAELSIPREGDAVLWAVMVVDQRRDSATTATVERVLDSFRLTEAAPRAAAKGSPDQGRGFVEATDLAAKP